MPIEFDNYRPIYIQIIEEIKIKILSGQYKLGEQLPSVRTLALDYKVNPNTVQRSYSILEEEKLVFTDSTNGRYVTNDNKLIEKLRKEIAEEKIKIFMENMNNLGIDNKTIIDYLKTK